MTITDSRPARSRPPLGLGSSLTAAYYGLGLAGLIVAEVGLVLDNSERTAPAGFNDSEIIEVTRRIEQIGRAHV